MLRERHLVHEPFDHGGFISGEIGIRPPRDARSEMARTAPSARDETGVLPSDGARSSRLSMRASPLVGDLTTRRATRVLAQKWSRSATTPTTGTPRAARSSPTGAR